MSKDKSAFKLWWERNSQGKQRDLCAQYSLFHVHLVESEIEKMWIAEGKPEPRELTHEEEWEWAYQCTVGNGINPEAVKEMYNALLLFIDCYGVEGAWVSEDIFNKAKAAIDKAKLI